MIPSKTDESVEKDANARAEELIKNVSGKETILVVEDEDQVRELVCEMLELHGYHMIKAMNGKEAIEEFNKNKSIISLILTDLVMPQMGGKKFIDSIDAGSDVKVIYMSGYTDNTIDRQGILNPNIQQILRI